MPIRPATLGAAVAGLLAIGGCQDSSLPAPRDDRFDAALFREPPRDLGPQVRWWWPGGAVDDATIASELGAIEGAGFAGVELQTLSFGMSPADLAADARIRTVGEPAHLAHVATFLREAKRRALHTSLTLGSGWPSGGTFSTDVRPLELLRSGAEVSGPATVSMPLPVPAAPGWTTPVSFLFPVVGAFVPPFDFVAAVAAPIVDGTVTPPVLGTPIDLTANVQNGMLIWDAPSGTHALVFFFRHRVDHLVAGDAFPNLTTPAHVVSHLDLASTQTLLGEQSAIWLDAIAPLSPDELFVDSFELVAELPWSDAFASRFETERAIRSLRICPSSSAPRASRNTKGSSRAPLSPPSPRPTRRAYACARTTRICAERSSSTPSSTRWRASRHSTAPLFASRPTAAIRRCSTATSAATSRNPRVCTGSVRPISSSSRRRPLTSRAEGSRARRPSSPSVSLARF